MTCIYLRERICSCVCLRPSGICCYKVCCIGVYILRYIYFTQTYIYIYNACNIRLKAKWWRLSMHRYDNVQENYTPLSNNRLGWC